jgi:hypothetical protein
MAGSMPVYSTGRRYTHTATCTVLIFTRTLLGKLPLHANATQTVDTRMQEDCAGDEH